MPTSATLNSADPGNEGNNSTDVNDPANLNTGALSTNTATETLEQKYEQLNKNLADLQNKIDAVTATGNNLANFNTLNGQVYTGDALSTINQLNKLNSNISGMGGFAVFNIYDNHAGDIVFKLADNNVTGGFSSASGNVSKNSDTGPGSSNLADGQSSFTVKEANGNDAKIVNDIVLQSSTGNNTASMNTGDGIVKTGNATSIGNVVNLANTNLNVSNWLFGVVNIFGTLAGNIILPKGSSTSSNTSNSAGVLSENSNTGFGSTNNATYDNTSLATFDNANTANITSYVEASANSGNNSSSTNTGGGNIVSGSSDVAVSNSTIANTNTNNEEGIVWMVIVNEAGKWVGHIIGSPWGESSASNSLPISSTTGGAGQTTYTADSVNSGTGAFSTNDASYDSSTNSTVTNNNTAEIINNISANADTGNNTATYNTGTSSIETGNAKVGLNLVNMVNTNVVAKKFVAILVNVLGKFLGDVIPPDAQNTSQSINDSTNSVSTPTPTLAVEPSPTPTLTDSRIGGIEPTSSPTLTPEPDPTVIPLPTVTPVPQQTAQFQYYYYYYYSDNTYQNDTTQYSQAVQKVGNSRQNVIKQRQVLRQSLPTSYDLIMPTVPPKRGLFVSKAFAKATESSLAGILLGGATLKVNQSWLSVIPLAILIIVLRRRRKINFSGYLYKILEKIL
ncbi:hypothetical protein A2960_00490 [Candidatus Gottesmanbacteria bacterium RIFCSPLOWO2_01_FULL_39_12b]|uniref:Uncharacterized protein n=1 Tax=Candidatus Gottesmanbacteria bacterium RIFCSPLOWO2_01_FULL_39_12b TaxID=1798388 RepID=A0A1F6APM0_9BACT|nr:MAG: hypothetical protein A2960_00490 [Candidatus Gottesmanbacteria bacterium RIFCSPLOWO2_01_FULL_39_12b]